FGGSVLTHELRGATDDMHQVERNLRLVESLGFLVADRRLVLDIADDDRRSATDLLALAGVTRDQPVALLHPGASAAARRYPAERYGDIARLLNDDGSQVVLTGTAREADVLASAAQHASGAVVMAGNTSLGQFAAMVE